MDLKRGVDLAVAEVVKDIERRSKTVKSSEEIAQVGASATAARRCSRTSPCSRGGEHRGYPSRWRVESSGRVRGRMPRARPAALRPAAEAAPAQRPCRTRPRLVAIRVLRRRRPPVPPQTPPAPYRRLRPSLQSHKASPSPWRSYPASTSQPSARRSPGGVPQQHAGIFDNDQCLSWRSVYLCRGFAALALHAIGIRAHEKNMHHRFLRWVAYQPMFIRLWAWDNNIRHRFQFKWRSVET